MTTQKISIDDLFKIKTIINVKILPNEQILFEEQSMSKEKNKYFSSIYKTDKDTQTPIQFTSGISQDKGMKLSPSKIQLAFLSARGGEKTKNQVWIMNLDGGESVKYTSVPNGVESFNWSHDGKKIVFTHRVNVNEQEVEDKNKEKKDIQVDDIELKLKKIEKEEKEKKKLDPRVVKNIVYKTGTSFLDDRYSHIYLLNLEDKKTERITKGETNYSSPLMNSDNTKIIATKHVVIGTLNDSYYHSLVEISLENKEEKELRSFYGWGADLRLSPDGQWIVYEGNESPKNLSTQNNKIWLYNLVTGEERQISKTIDNDAYEPRFSYDSKNIFFLVDEWDKNMLCKYDLENESVVKIHSADYVINSYDIDTQLELIALNCSTANDPSVLKIYNIVKNEEKTLWKSNQKWIEKRELAKITEIRYSGFNDKDIQGWLVKPSKFDKNKKYPLILDIHGGPHTIWSPHERSMWFEFQYFASKGYLIFFCNPQGTSGRGYAFRDVIANWGTEPAEDILKGVDEVIKNEKVDTDNLFITGGSYGGYMTAWIIGNINRFKAAAPQRGVYNLVSFWSTTDITQFTNDEMDAFPWEDLEKLWKESPIAYVQNITTPTRFIHSENDYRCPISQAEEMFSSLLKLGVEADFVRYPEEGHELSRSGKPTRMKDRLKKIVEWFDKHNN